MPGNCYTEALPSRLKKYFVILFFALDKRSLHNSKLFCEITQRVEGASGIESLLILTVAALDLAVVPRRIGTDQLMPDAQLRGHLFKRRQ